MRTRSSSIQLCLALAVATALAGCTNSDSGTAVATGDPSLLQHLAMSAKVPIPVACSVHNDLAHPSSAAVEATFRNTASKAIVGADLTVLDGMATSTYVPLAIPPGRSFVLRRALPLASAPSSRATCTLTMLQFADKSGWQYAPSAAPAQ